MRKVILFILLVVTVCFAVTPKFFLPIPIESSNGRPLLNQNVDLYTAGTATKVTDCTWLDGSRYYYTDTTAVTPGLYDIYINGNSFVTNIWIGTPTAGNLAPIWQADIADSLTSFLSVVSDSLDMLRDTTMAWAISESLNYVRFYPKFMDYPDVSVGYGNYVSLDSVMRRSDNDTADVLRTEYRDYSSQWRANVKDSLLTLHYWWDIIWTNAFVADTAKNQDVELWPSIAHEPYFNSNTDRDTLFSMPIRKTSDMDSMEIIYCYYSSNETYSWTSYFTVFNTTASTSQQGSGNFVTKRLVVSVKALTNNTVYSVLFSGLTGSTAIDVYVHLVSLSVLRKK